MYPELRRTHAQSNNGSSHHACRTFRYAHDRSSPYSGEQSSDCCRAHRVTSGTPRTVGEGVPRSVHHILGCLPGAGGRWDRRACESPINSGCE